MIPACSPNRGSFDAHLHAVGRGGLLELARLPHDLVILRVDGLVAGALTLAGGVGSGAKVLQAGFLSPFVEFGRGQRHGSQQGRGQSRDTHVDLTGPAIVERKLV